MGNAESIDKNIGAILERNEKDSFIWNTLKNSQK